MVSLCNSGNLYTNIISGRDYYHLPEFSMTVTTVLTASFHPLLSSISVSIHREVQARLFMKHDPQSKLKTTAAILGIKSRAASAGHGQDVSIRGKLTQVPP